jgi:tetratricopeptide (TPR) repeat protein
LLGQGRAYEALGEIAEAVQRYSRLAEVYPQSPLAPRGLYQAGHLLQTQKAYEEAQRYFEEVVQRYPTDPTRYASLLQWGMTLLEQHQYERAVALLQQAQQAPDLQEGINAYLRVAYLYPDAGRLVTGALQQAARNYVKLGKCPEALTVYAKLLEQTSAAQETQAIQQEMQQSGCQ